VPDGGEDGHIRWEGSPDSTDWIPRRYTLFQVKATRIGPKEAGQEVLADDGSLKARVAEVIGASGAYILFMANRARSIQTHIAEIRGAIVAHGPFPPSSVIVNVYDCESIADWTNHHVSAVVQVRDDCGVSIPSRARTWQSFEKLPRLGGPYFTNPILDGYIDEIQRAAEEPRTVVRITGLSGLGKTRLVLEAFRPPEDPSQARVRALSSQLIYLSASVGESTAADFVAGVCRSGLQAVLVIDECALRLHDELAKETASEDSQIAPITIWHEPEKPTEDTRLIALEPRICGGVIRTFLGNVCPGLSEADIDKIANLASGFPKIAAILAERHLRKVDSLANLDDKRLAQRLLWGDEPIVRDEHRVLQACSIFSHLGFEGRVQAQRIAVCRHICGFQGAAGEQVFYAVCKKFLDRGILEKYGDFIRVSPPPLAIQLAAEFWGDLPPEHTESVVHAILEAGLSESFCLQIRNLHFLAKARELAERLCGEGGPFGVAEGALTGLGARFLSTFAEVNPPAAAQALDRVIGTLSRIELLGITGDARRHFVWALEKLSWWREIFPTAARLLMGLAAGENEKWGNNATNQFLHLFHIFLPGTLATLDDRIPIIDDALSQQETEYRALGVRALGRALRTGHFSRTGGVEVQGSRAPREDYRPATWAEVFSCWDWCSEKLVGIAASKDSLSDLALSEAANCLRGLIEKGRLDCVDKALQTVLAVRADWPDALAAIRDVIAFGISDLPDADQARIREWITLLTPQDLAGRLRTLVPLGPFVVEKDEDGEVVDASGKPVVALADELGRNPESLEPHLQDLLRGEQRFSFLFGRELVQRVADPRKLVSQALDALRSQRPQEGNPALLCGYLAGAADRALVRETLVTVCSDERLLPYAVDVTRWSRPEVDDLNRIMALAESGRIGVERLRMFAYNGVLSHLPSNEVTYFCTELARLGGASYGIHVLFLYCYGESARWAECAGAFRRLLMTPRVLGSGGMEQDAAYDCGQVAKRLLELAPADAELGNALVAEVVRVCSESDSSIGEVHQLQSLVRLVLGHQQEAAWQAVGSAYLSGDRRRRENLKSVLGTGFDRMKTDAVICAIAPEMLVTWCRANHPRGPVAVAACMPLYAGEEDPPQWHFLAKRVIDEFRDSTEVLSSVTVSMNCYTSWGSLVPMLERQAALIGQLLNHHCARVREWAERTVQGLRSQIEAERREDAERGAGIW